MGSSHHEQSLSISISIFVSISIYICIYLYLSIVFIYLSFPINLSIYPQISLIASTEHLYGVSINGGTPSYHPFLDGIFPDKPTILMGFPMKMDTPQMGGTHRPASTIYGY